MMVASACVPARGLGASRTGGPSRGLHGALLAWGAGPECVSDIYIYTGNRIRASLPTQIYVHAY